jgi:Holliday junction resolvase RusA-like endonuclease
MIHFTVPGEPVGKARPRLGRRGRVYTPAATKRHEALVRESWQLAGGRRIEGPLAIHVEAETARPASHRLKRGGLSAAGRRSAVPTKKPDLDNVLKLVADALNGHAYQDDAWIVAATVVRRWAPEGSPPRTVVRLYPALTEEPA